MKKKEKKKKIIMFMINPYEPSCRRGVFHTLFQIAFFSGSTALPFLELKLAYVYRYPVLSDTAALLFLELKLRVVHSCTKLPEYELAI